MATLRISHNIKIIADEFYGIRDYNRIVIPGSVEEIYRSFCSLPNIKEIEFLEPKNEKEKGLSLISNSSFGDSSIGKIKLPNTLKNIQNSFNFCKKLEELELNNDLEVIFDSFNDCNIKKVLFPESIYEVMNSFKNNKDLSEIKVLKYIKN